MYGLSACRLAGRDNRIDVEIAFAGRRRPKTHCLISHHRGLGETIGIGIDGDRGDAHPSQRLDDPDGDFAAVGDQDLLEHAQSSPSQISTRTGVGSKPLQGLLI